MKHRYDTETRKAALGNDIMRHKINKGEEGEDRETAGE